MKSFFTRLLLSSLLITLFCPMLRAQSKLSPMTQLVVKGELTKEASKGMLKSFGNNRYITVFVSVHDKSGFSVIEEHGGIIRTIKKMICTALVPFDRVDALASNPQIKSISIARSANHMLDAAGVAIRSHHVHPGSGALMRGYKGEGVVVGMIDSGFDFTHPTFYDASGTTSRIKYVWDQNRRDGSSPSGFNYGREFTSPGAILEAMTDDMTENHGTHTAGIAAGSGYTTTYTGIAPESDICIVGTNRSDAGIIDGVEYIKNKALKAGKPCVINISLGSQMGAHDGSSDFDRMLSEIVEPGVIVVGSAGNDGGSNIHVRATGPDITSTISSPGLFFAPNYMLSDLWGSAGENYKVRVSVYNNATGSLLGETSWVDASADTDKGESPNFIINTSTRYLVQMACALSPQNNKYNMLLFISADRFTQSESVVISIDPLNNGYVDSWASLSTYTNGLSGVPNLVSGNSDYTVCEIGGVSKDIISVGAYTTKDAWTALDGSYYQIGKNGDIASFSSKGPTADGRMKPDVTAPGAFITSAVNHHNMEYNDENPFSVARTTFNNTPYYWAVQQGTSMSAPVVTGAIALWLEADPSLTVKQAKKILANTSSSPAPSFTPDNTWGYGILNAYNGIVELLQMVEVPVNKIDQSILVYPNPVTDNCHIQVSANNKIQELELFQVSGNKILGMKFSGTTNRESVNLSSLAKGIYLMKLSTRLGSRTTKIVLK